MNRYILGFEVEDQNDPCIRSLDAFREYFVDHITTKIMKKRTSSLIHEDEIIPIVKNYFDSTLEVHDKVFSGRIDISVLSSSRTLLIRYYPTSWLDPGEVLEIYSISFNKELEIEYLYATLIKQMKKNNIEFEYSCSLHDVDDYHSMQIFLKNSTFEFFWKMINMIEIEFFRNIDSPIYRLYGTT